MRGTHSTRRYAERPYAARGLAQVYCICQVGKASMSEIHANEIKVFLVCFSALLGIWALFVWAWLFWLVVGLVLVYGLFRVWLGWRHNVAGVRMIQAEASTKEAVAALHWEAVETAKARRLWIPGDYVGAQLRTPDQASLYHVWGRGSVKVSETAIEALPAGPPALPSAASVFELLPTLESAAGRILLGFDAEGPVWLRVDELLSVAMAGNSGRGKSKALLWLALQLIRQNITVVFLDGKGDLRRWLSSYHAVAYTPAEIKQSVDAILLEADWRLRMSADDANASYAPVLVVIDELDLVIGRYEKTLALIEMLTKKTRSVNIHGIYSNQSVPADLVGGVQNRGVIVSRICLYCDDEAARLIGVRANNGAAALLQQIAPPASPGLAVARTAAFGWKLLAFPYVPDGAIRWMLDRVPELPPLPPNPNYKPSLSARPEPEIPAKVPSVEERERERIKGELKAHPEWSNARIFQALGFRNNNKLSLIKALREEGA